MNKGIYKITNDRTGEVYIGQSNNMYRRYLQHMDDLANGTHHNRGMQSDFNKGDTFSFEILEFVDGSREDLHESEKYQIRKHNSFYAGYNQTPGGEYDKYKGQYHMGGGRKPTYKIISVKEANQRRKKQNKKESKNKGFSALGWILGIIVLIIFIYIATLFPSYSPGGLNIGPSPFLMILAFILSVSVCAFFSD